MKEHLTQKDILDTLREELPYLRDHYGVQRIALFGSFAKSEETQESDIDVLVELAEPSGFKFVNLAYYLEDVLGREVDLATFNQFRASRKKARYRNIVRDVERTLIDVEEARSGFSA